MEHATDWEIFFDENPKPIQFEEKILQIKDFCQKLVKENKPIVLVTVTFEFSVELFIL